MKACSVSVAVVPTKPGVYIVSRLRISVKPQFGADCLSYLLQGALTSLSLALLLRLWRLDLSVPLNYQGDAIFELALAKSIASDGWIWWISDLGAPFGFDAAAFPQNITASSAMMWLIARFTENPAVILNSYWLVSCVLTSLTCAYSLRLFSYKWPVVLVISTLYALLPYAFERNISHISLTYIFVPIICTHCILVISNTDLLRLGIKYWTIVMLSSFLLGIDYVYNAFFACFFLLAAVFISVYVNRSVKPLLPGLIVVSAVLIFVAVNFVPSAMTWMANGVPPNMGYKSAADAEHYGLKIRHVISPAILDRYADSVNFPLENENKSARLGIILGIGYLLSVMCALFYRIDRHGVLWISGVFVVIGTFLATIGGLGSIFNILISPDIRAYNRIIVFIAFFSAVVLGGFLSLPAQYVGEKSLTASRRWARRTVVIALLSFTLLIGLIDQGDAARSLVQRYEQDRMHVVEERDLVDRIERLFPNVDQIYQLPERPFPLDGGLNKMGVYDHGRPYLWSRQIRWSWPAFSHRAEAWLEKVGPLSSEMFSGNLRLSGFNGLWLDRAAYAADDLRQVEATLRTQIGDPRLESISKRYAFFDLGIVDEGMPAYGESSLVDIRRSFLSDPFLGFASAIYQEEKGESGEHFRWSQQSSHVILGNPSSTIRRVKFSAHFSALPGGRLHVSGAGVDWTVKLTSGNAEFSISLELPAKQSTQLQFDYRGERVVAENDPRKMYFRIINPTLQEE